jgi:hypothetical protein
MGAGGPANIARGLRLESEPGDSCQLGRMSGSGEGDGVLLLVVACCGRVGGRSGERSPSDSRGDNSARSYSLGFFFGLPYMGSIGESLRERVSLSRNVGDFAAMSTGSEPTQTSDGRGLL